MRSRAKIGESRPGPTAAWRGLVRPVHQLPGRSTRLRNLTAGDLRRAARDHCRRASHAAFRARNHVCSARAAAARAGDSLNARPPRAVAKPRATSGGRFCEVLLRARTKGQAKSWTLHSVADAKWSTTGNFQVASCLWTSSCFVDDILDLGSTFNTFKKFSRKSQRITEHISGRRRMCHLRHPVAARYLKKGARVVSLTGKHWTEANIGNALAGRELRRSRLRSAVNRARSSHSTGATPVIGGCGR
jgi:YaiI/YqxD family uncharacterized protein